MARVTPNALRASAFLICFVSLDASAQTDASGCADQFSDCKDTCSLRYGSVIKERERVLLGRCLDRCNWMQVDCREKYLTTQQGKLDDGALKKVKAHDDDLREDNRRVPVVDTPAPAAAKPAPKPDAGQPASTVAPAVPEKKKQKPLDEWDPQDK